MLACDKHSSLLQKLDNHGRKSFITLGPDGQATSLTGYIGNACLSLRNSLAYSAKVSVTLKVL
jgi:hypothetical protein